MRQQQGDDGYTLLELLTATTLAGFLLVAVSGALSFTGRARASIDRSEARFADVDSAEQMISKVFENVQPVLNGISYADRTIDFTGATDKVQFIGRLPEAIAADKTAKEELSLVGDGPTKDLWLSWSLDLPAAQRDASRPVYRIKLIDNVRSLRFAFFGSGDRLHAPSWRDSWEGLSTIPLLMRVELEQTVLRRISRAVFFIAPAVAATPGCRFDPENVKCRRVQ